MVSHRTLSVSHLPAAPFTVLRLDYLIICQHDYCAAKILSLFEAWTESRLDAIEQAAYYNRAAAKEGSKPNQDESTWLYNTLDNIRERLLGEYSIKTINKALKNLEVFGFVKTRFDPKHKWNRTKQYQFQTQSVQSAIYQITQEQLEEYGMPKTETLDFLHLVNLPDAFGHSTKSIQENYQIDEAHQPDRTEKNTKTIYKNHYKESLQNIPSAWEPQSKERASQPEPQEKTHQSCNSNLILNEQKRGARNSASYGSRSSPELVPPSPAWMLEVDSQEWEKFLSWKAEQAPPQVNDPFGWAYNTLKSDSERARLSLKSFRLHNSQSPPGNGRLPDELHRFQTWERSQHVDLARQYAANTVTFLHQQSWHASWVEYVNAHLPEIFAEIYRGNP